MAKYFDKDFFKFFIGFLAIISTSLVILMATRMYQERQINAEAVSATAVKAIQK